MYLIKVKFSNTKVMDETKGGKKRTFQREINTGHLIFKKKTRMESNSEIDNNRGKLQRQQLQRDEQIGQNAKVNMEIET